MEKDDQQSTAPSIEDFFKNLSFQYKKAKSVPENYDDLVFTDPVIEEYLRKLVLGFDKKNTPRNAFNISAQILSTATNAHRVQESRLEQVPVLVADRIFAMPEEDSDQIRLALTSKKMGFFWMRLLRKPSSILLVPFHASPEEEDDLCRPLIFDAVEWLEPKMRYCHFCGNFKHLDKQFWESFHLYIGNFLQKTQHLQKPKAQHEESRMRFVEREWTETTYKLKEEFDYFDHHWFSKQAKDYIKWSVFNEGGDGYEEQYDEHGKLDPKWRCRNTTMAEFADATFSKFKCLIHYYGEELLRWISCHLSPSSSNMYFFGTMKEETLNFKKAVPLTATMVSLAAFNRLSQRAPQSVDCWWKEKDIEGICQTKKMLTSKKDDSEYDPDEDDSDADSNDNHDTSDNSVTTDLSEWG